MIKPMSSHQSEAHLTLTVFSPPKCVNKMDDLLQRNDRIDKDDEEDEFSTMTETTDISIQTRLNRKCIPSSMLRKCIKQIVPTHNPKKRNIKLMDWKRYHRLNVIYAFIDELERDYPAICTVSVIGKSVEGRDIKMLKISNSDARNSAVWIDGSIHAREWISASVVTYIADTLVRNFKKLSNSITNKDWHIVPVLNPDGYEYTHTQDRMWRKNRACYDGQYGVDLNRNFSCGWGNNGDEGSSDEPNNVFYRGPAPFSEPETIAVRDTILSSTTPFKVFLSFHSYFELIIFPWGYKKDPCPHYLQLLEGGAVMARAIYDCTRMTYKVGSTKDMTYFACGTSTDWSYGIAKIPFSYMIELRSKKHKFKLPKDQIVDTCSEIWCAVKCLMDFVDQKYSVKVASTKDITQVWQVKFIREGQRYFVKSLDTVGAINIWKEEHSTMDIMVEGSRAAQVSGMLHEREIPYSIAIGDVRAMLEREQGATVTKMPRINSADIRHNIDWKHYHRLDVVYEFLENLSTDYPYLCSVIIIGKSTEGRDIKMLKVSNGNKDNIGVWLDGSIHPREWITTAVVTYIADRLVRTYQDQPDSVTNKDWYIVPVLNPDGYEYTHTHDRMWRKNRAKYGECIGVDLNRNFSYGWGEKGEEGSSEDPGNIFFRGPKPFSEPETAAVRAIYQTNGHTYKVGSTKDLMYFAAGTSTDWSYAVANIPYSYMIELRGKTHRFLLPKEEIISTSVEVLNGVLSLMDFIDKKCRSSQSCVCPK
ncbi:uncharacterized protein LOC113518740 [Galleria mellonella]|uniref:Uncharacterized protein LOC113518740 n=1 Tax=Galleria mellonella TaxID=7137 RepID=A0A6J3C194_GALME|nr:uncharacterized protein LOC113518740 [Galleria mellonella]